ncbi:MAG: leucyl aminopeptidase [Chloroflexota bacterium]
MEMQISAHLPTAVDAPAVVVFVMSGESWGASGGAINTALNGWLDDLRATGDMSGQAEEVTLLYSRGALPAPRVVLVGLGEADTVNARVLRRASAAGVQKARRAGAVHIALALPPDLNLLAVDEVAQAIVEGAVMGLYTYRGQKTGEANGVTVTTLEIAAADLDASLVERGAARGRAYAEGALVTRDLANLPPNICTPAYMAQRAMEVARAYGMRIEVLEENQMRALKMGALLAVAQGSHDRPRFIIMQHNADCAEELDTVVLVGKGVTFDTGGYSLKSRDGMIGMKGDMSGGAAVIGAMQIVAALDLPLRVVGLVPASDNNVSDRAYRPQEVITASNGKTIEIISTDAEGRLLLADALVYATRYAPAAVVDIATLTGACMVALGNAAAGLFSIDEALRDRLVQAAEATGERLWPMPIFDEYRDSLKSLTADTKNSGARHGGAGVAAAFLSQFVDYPAWAHIDMAGMMADAEGDPTIPNKGATGYGARLLARFVENWSERESEG